MAQLPVTLTLLWNLAGAQAAKPDLWQVSQLADAVAATDWNGMWLGLRPSAGADPNAMRAKGGTPLHNLAFGGADLQPAILAQVVQLFADHKADLSLPADFDGATPLDVAKAKGNQAAVDALGALGAQCKKAC